MKFRFYLSLIIAKLSCLFLKITKLSSGTAIIGLITLKICPEFLRYINPLIKKNIINITGTNGKTTTSGLISHILENNKKKTLTNAQGANMLNGIINAFALQACPFSPHEYSVIETDEAFLEKVYSKMSGDYLLVTNLFEDQTDRFANPHITKSLIQKGIDKCAEVQLVLNADEPISASLKSNKNAIYFGINNVYDEQGNIVEYEKKSFKCPICEKNMEYSKNFYSQVGHYSCSCGYSRPTPEYLADVKLYKNHLELILNEEVYEIPLVGLFNAYNALGAIVLAKKLGLENIKDTVKTFKVAFGRSERRSLYGHNTLIQLIKNPAGTNEVLKTVDLDSNILIAVNNNIADGTDVSWINQADFEKLGNARREIVVTGLCANEMSKRLEDAGAKNIKTISDINKAVEYIGKTSDNNITVLTTYTALLKIDKIKEMKKCF